MRIVAYALGLSAPSGLGSRSRIGTVWRSGSTIDEICSTAASRSLVPTVTLALVPGTSVPTSF